MQALQLLYISVNFTLALRGLYDQLRKSTFIHTFTTSVKLVLSLLTPFTQPEFGVNLHFCAVVEQIKKN